MTKSESMSNFAINTKRIINERGLKQCAVARMAGYTTQRLNNMLNGRKVITEQDIVILSGLLEVTPNDLLKEPQTA